MLEKNDDFLSRERHAGYEPQVIESATVLLVGLGALGQNVGQCLGLLGVGEVRCVDRDTFEDHNRTRLPFYPSDPKTEGLEKARVVAKRAGALAPERGNGGGFKYAHAWVEELGDGAFIDADVVVSCVDVASARRYLAKHTRLNAIPLVEGGFNGPSTTISTFSNSREHAYGEPCWSCANPETEGSVSCQLYARNAEAAGIIPAIQAGASFLGALMAEAVVQFLHDTPILAGKSVDANVRTGAARTVIHAKDPMCPGPHRVYSPVAATLSIAPQAQVCQLVSEARMAGEVRGNFTLSLPSPLYLDVPCISCGEMTTPAMPLHRWLHDGRCSECGGHVKRASKSRTASRIYPFLHDDLPEEVLNLSCSDLGLNYGAVVELNRNGHDPLVLRLHGGAADLFITTEK